MINFIDQLVAEKYITTAESDITIVGIGAPIKLSNINLQQAEYMLACNDANIQVKPTLKPGKKTTSAPAEGEAEPQQQ